MPEIPKPHEQPITPEEQMLLESHARFEQVSAELSRNIPEIATRPEIILAGNELIDQFGLKPSLFEDEGRWVMFASIASRWADYREGTDEVYDKEKTFTADTIALLAYDHSDKLGEAKRQIIAERGEFDDDTRQIVYDKYTDEQLSEQLHTKITEQGFLDDVKARLGVTPENEDDFTLRALSIGSNMQTMGLDVPAIDYATIDYNNADDIKKLSENAELRTDIIAWKKDLEQRGKDFMRELGEEGEQFADAWVTRINGKQSLCISSALAEKLLDPGLTENTPYYDERSAKVDRAILEHEYTHTQGGVNIDRSVTFGTNIEELRAEHFSGNNMGYQDIKGFFRDYSIITGQNISAELESLTKGGTPAEVYGFIANRVGLREVVSIALASPNNYLNEQSNSFAKEAHGHIGGFDGVLKTLLESEVAKGNNAAIEDRVTEAAKIQMEVVNRPDSVIDIDSIASRRKGMGLNFITEMVADRARDMQTKQPRVM